MEAISLWHCWGTTEPSARLYCWIDCFSSFSWKYSIDSIWVQVRHVGWPIKHSNIMVSKPLGSGFGTVGRAGRYGQNLYHDIFFNFSRYDIIPISIWTLKKSLIKTAKNAHNLCLKTYEKWTCQVYELLLLNYIIFWRGGGGDNTNQLMFTFYLYLAFIQTRNAKLLSNKHLRLTLLLLISLTRLTYSTSQKFLNSKIFNVF